MNEISFELDETKDRPVIKVMSLDALIDTGAEISVCNLSPAVFELITEYKEKTPYTIKGFGGECSGTKYILRNFSVGELKFQDVPFFIPDEPMDDKYKFILAAPLFLQVYYAFDMPNHKMIIRY